MRASRRSRRDAGACREREPRRCRSPRGLAVVCLPSVSFLTAGAGYLRDLRESRRGMAFRAELGRAFVAFRARNYSLVGFDPSTTGGFHPIAPGAETLP